MTQLSGPGLVVTIIIAVMLLAFLFLPMKWIEKLLSTGLKKPVPPAPKPAAPSVTTTTEDKK